MFGMFYSADSLNRDLNGWDTSSVTAMDFMFMNDGLYNQDLSSWESVGHIERDEYAGDFP